jgi:SRSO17 transposase
VGSSPGTLGSESRLSAYVEALSRSLGHADRVAPFRSYCTGLLLPGTRKSVEPIAARVEPGRVQVAHQSLHHFVAKADWSDAALLAAVRTCVLPIIEQQGAIRGWMVDDTGMPKKGTHSVGVARQYCGQLGKQDNCQVAVTLSLASDHASLPIAHRLYLPQPWADDPARRGRAGVPDDIIFQTKPQIALAQIKAAIAAGVRPAPVLADAGYGVDTAFRDGITDLGLAYVVGIQSHTSLWPPGQEPLPAKPWSGRGRPPSLVRRDAEHAPMPAKDLAGSLPKRAWRRVTRREGSNTKLCGRFAPCGSAPPIATTTAPSPAPRSGCCSNGPRVRLSRQNTGSPPCPPTPVCVPWSIRPSCAGGSSATTRTSSRSLASVTTRGVDGVGFITTQRCASRLMACSSPSGALFPPRQSSGHHPSKHLPYPQITNPAAPPIRPERHVANSISTLRTTIARALARSLPRCPCCQIRTGI